MSHNVRGRWLTFSLRSLFVLVMVVAAYFAGWRSALWIAEREKDDAVRKAIEEIQAAQKHGAGVNVHFSSGSVRMPPEYWEFLMRPDKGRGVMVQASYPEGGYVINDADLP